MEIFQLIPSSIFTLLTSKNREIYAQGLLIVRQAFAHEVMIERSNLEDELTNKLHNELLDMDLSGEEGFNAEDRRDIATRAKGLVRKYLETGWIESEFAKGSKLQEFLTLPPYSISMLDLLNSFANEEVKEYDAFMYAMYSALNNADKEYTDYRYTAISSVYEKVQEFESTLKGLFASLKKHYSRLSKLKTVNQMLYEHFDNYQKDVIKQIYLPMKTKDSISRFKGPILEILSKWYRNPETMENITKQAMIYRQFKSEEEARDDVLQRINFIIDKLGALLILLESIDERNNEYVQSATDKMRFLLRNDKSIAGKLTKIFEKLSFDMNSGNNDNLVYIQDTISLNSATFLSEDSMYNRSNVERDYNSDAIEISDAGNELLDKVYDDFIDSVTNNYSEEGINNYMKEILAEMDKVNSKDIPLSNANDLIMFIYSFIKGFDRRAFYKVNLNEGNIPNHKYLIPDIDFVRKGK